MNDNDNKTSANPQSSDPGSGTEGIHQARIDIIAALQSVAETLASSRGELSETEAELLAGVAVKIQTALIARPQKVAAAITQIITHSRCIVGLIDQHHDQLTNAMPGDLKAEFKALDAVRKSVRDRARARASVGRLRPGVQQKPRAAAKSNHAHTSREQEALTTGSSVASSEGASVKAEAKGLKEENLVKSKPAPDSQKANRSGSASSQDQSGSDWTFKPLKLISGFGVIALLIFLMVAVALVSSAVAIVSIERKPQIARGLSELFQRHGLVVPINEFGRDLVFEVRGDEIVNCRVRPQ